MSKSTPFHAGETAVQTRLGVREAIEDFARRVVRDHLPAQHREFYRQLPFLVLAARDERSRTWATIVAAADGVASSPDPRTLALSRLPLPGDPLAQALALGDDVGVLGIEFHTRRRNRVNGRIAGRDAGGFRLHVEQSFGNCPQYIHLRNWEAVTRTARSQPQRSTGLDTRQRAWIEQADTFFVASGFRGEGEDPAHGMDASHRGGARGFVRVQDERTIAWPDYPGNNHYNTIGNLVMDSGVGLLFVDFATGSLLQVTGRAELDWAPDQARWPGAQRVIEVHIDAVVAQYDALPLRWRAPAHLDLVIDDVVDESDHVRSFWLRDANGSPLPPFRAGQHVPVEVMIDGVGEERSYSLSSSPREPRWRISVKRREGGRVSDYLHARATAGTHLQAGLPAGDFTTEEHSSPLLLIGAGIGVTPLVSMLADGASSGRDITFLYVARSGCEAALLPEIEACAQHRNVRLVRIFTRPDAEDHARRRFDQAGRLSLATIQALLPEGECDAYVCGPVTFVGDVMRWLVAAGAPATRLHYETFG